MVDCLLVVLFFSLIASSGCLWGKREEVMSCDVAGESAFRVASVGLCGTQVKVVLEVSNGVVAAVFRGSEKR